jgi:hypothetical protein
MASAEEETTKSPAELRPFVELTPEACSEILRAYEMGLQKFRRWGIVLPRSGRIEETRSWLQRVVKQDSLGSSDEELSRTSSAVASAIDLYHISTCLGDQSDRSVATELRKITTGQQDSTPNGYLSQFWVGALLAKSKLRTTITTVDIPGMAKPDFIVPYEGIDFIVEVKRPTNYQAAKGLLNAAGEQLRSRGLPGMLFMELTDCMSVDPFAVSRDATSVRAQVKEELNTAHKELVRFVESYSHSNKFQQLVLLFTYARFWPMTIAEDVRRDAGMHMRADGFTYLWSSQVTELVRSFLSSLQFGFKQLTGNEVRFNWL